MAGDDVNKNQTGDGGKKTQNEGEMIDHNSLFYLHASDYPKQMHVNDVLTNKNYNDWEQEMMNFMFAKNKTGFIDGSIKKPETKSDKYLPWMRCDTMIKGWGKKTYEFLMGLDDQFSVIKTQILAMKPTPDLSAAYHLVAEDEQQHTIASSKGADLKAGNLIGVGDCRGGLYWMGGIKEERKAMTVTIDAWHRRLRHASNIKFSRVSFLKDVSSSFNAKVCDSCNKAKLTRANYFLTIVDDYSSMNKFYKERGIVLETTCPHTPQQNGVVERKHRHLLEIARALRFEASLPTTFWGECIFTATYIVNRLPSKRINDKTPYEVLFGQKPEYDHMRVFGCMAYYKNTETNGDNFEPRGKPGVFFGYPPGKKGYKIYDLEERKMVMTRDARFVEEIFPFSKAEPKVFEQEIFEYSSLIPQCDEPHEELAKKMETDGSSIQDNEEEQTHSMEDALEDQLEDSINERENDIHASINSKSYQ
uniref:Retrovirus-related Pol polyprotein from transposon TNT 1-94 n=1 Tax=Tanacetum cinerariifolium TaxID=118510 RepID=A0A6L2LY51_TANCI|nr:retrovirus-related Pol polyprotein from transposon TNT 1-94 [Tanacetum cinerariifolium]